jgi:hypothetical protein
VEAGEYSRPEVTQYVADVLEKRRDAIGRYYFDRISPLDEFSLTQAAAGYRLFFHDLALERGYERQENRTYRFWLEDVTGNRLAPTQDTQSASGHLDFPTELLSRAGRPDSKPDRFGRVPTVRLLIQALSHGGARALPVEVVLGYQGNRAELVVLGCHHAVRQ